MTATDAAKAELNPSKKPRKLQRPHPRWMLLANGWPYRFVMRRMHAHGWCYPNRSYVNDTAVWCHWCGMRGSRPVIDSAEMLAEIAQKMSARSVSLPEPEETK